MSDINNSFKAYYNSQEPEEKVFISEIKRETKLIVLKYLIPCGLIIVLLFVILIGVQTKSSVLLQSNKFNLFKLSQYFSFYWIISTFGLFLILKIFLIFRNNITQSFRVFIKKELKSLDLNLKTKYSYQLGYMMSLIISSIIFIIEDVKILQISNKSSFILKILFIIILFILFLFQIGSNTKRVKLKEGYFISIKIRAPIFKKSEIDMIRIYLKSSIIKTRFNKDKEEILSTISNKRWLEIEKTPILKNLNLNPFVKFTEFSSYQNFYNKFLNLALAIRAWDKKLKSHLI